MSNMTFGVNILPNDNAKTLGNADKKWNIYPNKINGLQTGTGTAGQAGSSSVAYVPTLWKFDLNMTPVEGDMVTIKVPLAGVNAGVWLSVDNGSHYYPIAVNGTTRLTTQFGVDQAITLIYLSDQSIATYGTTVSGAAAGASTTTHTIDKWLVVNYYDANTTYTNAKLGQGYATCTTAAATAAKTASLSSFTLTTGGIVAVKFSYDVPANATLSINSTTAKAMYYKGAKITSGVIKAGDIGVFIYSSYYHLIAIDSQIDHAPQTFTTTIPTTGWTQGTDIYSIAVTVTGLPNTGNGIIGLVQSGTEETDADLREAFSLITRAVMTTNTLTVYATEVPSVALPVQVGVFA